MPDHALPQPDTSGEGETVESLTITGLTASRLVQTDGDKALASVADLTSWIAGTSNQVVVGDDGDGTLTLSLPQSIHTSASVTFGDVTAATVRGGTSSGGALALSSTSHATKGYFEFDGNVRLHAVTANVLEQRSTTNAQSYYIYNTYTNSGNYERFAVSWSSNVLFLRTENLGAGSARQINLTSANQIVFQTNGANTRLRIDTNGHGLAHVDNSYDWGGSSNRWRNIYAGTQFIGPAGSEGAPVLVGTGGLTTGVFFPTTASVGVSVGGAEQLRVIADQIKLDSALSLAWTDNNPGNTVDLTLRREAANTLALRNGTAANSVRFYNTYTNASNFERTIVGYVGDNTFYLASQALGTGTVRNITLATGGVFRWSVVGTSGHLNPSSDNTYDVGSGSFRLRTGYFGTSVVTPLVTRASADLTISTTTSGNIVLTPAGNITISDAKDIALNTSTGTKIGTATTQKLGFWNATPVVQQAHIADPSGGGTQDAEARTAINAINAVLAATGLTAAS